MARTIAIGDVHGCDRALAAVLDRIAPSQDDVVVQLGDLVDRGVDSCSVIDRMMRLALRCRVVQLIGDHEELMLDAFNNPAALDRWLRNGGDCTLSSYGWSPGLPLREVPRLADHVAYLQNGVNYLETDTYVFVHAGFEEDVAWENQSPMALRWRVISAATKPHCSGKHVICGHTAQRSGNVLKMNGVTCIDTNCVRGGWLTALDVTNNVVWQVNNVGEIRKTQSLRGSDELSNGRSREL
ncbi:metallophosphoesterase [Anatilimnocola floriformis]|uniref:metallophosphoesterase n=1 Tax=Anatilimnocola floriformis TaxID=2948575 RepID=UPI0020C40D7D|nr:metallophosphoesterase [Anatilimnocola floriformis]